MEREFCIVEPTGGLIPSAKDSVMEFKHNLINSQPKRRVYWLEGLLFR